ncbi:hypothetical protein DSC47_01820 [Elizabethkingia miricola]|nr:hypothetical protein BAY07_14560 [Elizabethkingia bruuniana]OPC67227.1 hypothetical protein BAY13_15455 [Elizabethkingia bruuniana]RBI93660.1 hypothetical protein DSC47_01820 [Elizabethkingia miricola]
MFHRHYQSFLQGLFGDPSEALRKTGTFPEQLSNKGRTTPEEKASHIDTICEAFYQNLYFIF